MGSLHHCSTAAAIFNFETFRWPVVGFDVRVSYPRHRMRGPRRRSPGPIACSASQSSQPPNNDDGLSPLLLKTAFTSASPSPRPRPHLHTPLPSSTRPSPRPSPTSALAFFVHDAQFENLDIHRQRVDGAAGAWTISKRRDSLRPTVPHSPVAGAERNGR